MATELKPKRKGNYHQNGNQKHGLYHENANLFNTWQTMKGRCENPNRPKYKDYGGRGIKVCSEWHEASNIRCRACWVDDAMGLIDDSPTVDAVEVVRCCDCQHCDVFQKEVDSETILICMIHSFELVDPTDFCSYGERKDNAQY